MSENICIAHVNVNITDCITDNIIIHMKIDNICMNIINNMYDNMIIPSYYR